LAEFPTAVGNQDCAITQHAILENDIVVRAASLPGLVGLPVEKVGQLRKCRHWIMPRLSEGEGFVLEHVLGYDWSINR